MATISSTNIVNLIFFVILLLFILGIILRKKLIGKILMIITGLAIAYYVFTFMAWAIIGD